MQALTGMNRIAGKARQAEEGKNRQARTLACMQVGSQAQSDRHMQACIERQVQAGWHRFVGIVRHAE